MGSSASTPNQTNLTVESTPAPASSSSTADYELQKACFGAGCYWGTEKYFKKEFPKTGKGEVLNGLVGFMGPSSAPENPTYEQVCRGTTGHVEVYQFEYPKSNETYRELVKFFFQFHDPTVLNSQGNDCGTQYASVIYTFDEDQYTIAKEVIADVQRLIDSGKITTYLSNKVTTDVRPATTFYPAHAAHQEYLDRNPNGYCNHRYRIKVWPE